MMLRALRRNDAPVLSALQRQVLVPPWSPQAFADMLDQPCYQGWALQALSSTGQDESVHAENVYAMALVRTVQQEAELTWIQVAQNKRGQGQGSRLLTHVLTALTAQGVRDVHLEVAQTNTPALRLYDRCGFQITGRRPGYYRHSHGREDALTLTKTSA